MTTPNPHLPDSHPAPGYPPEYAAPTQWDAQPMNGAMGQGYVPDAQHGYWGQEPAPRPEEEAEHRRHHSDRLRHSHHRGVDRWLYRD